MFKKLIILTLILFFALFKPFVILAQDYSESESFLAAKSAYDDGYYTESIDLFNKFLDEFPTSPAIFEAKLYIAQCLFYSNRFIESRDTLMELEKSYVPFAIEDRFLFLCGQIYIRVKDFKEAARYLKKIIDNHPDSPLFTNAKMQLGWVLFQDAKYEQAEKIFDSLSKSEDLSIQEEALFKRGESLFFIKKYNDTIEIYNSFVKIFPKSNRLAKAYFYMAEADFYSGDLQNAVEYYSQALALAGDDDSLKAISLQGLGWSYLKQNKLSKAEESLLKVEKLAEDDFNKENFLFGMATLYFESNKFDKAVLYYDELINRYPHSELLLKALFGKAQCLTNLSRLDAAEPLYEIVIDRLSDDANPEIDDLRDNSYYGLGCIYFTQKKMDEAITYFEKTASLTKDKKLKRSSLIYIADAYQELKKFDKAIKAYSKILKDYSANTSNDYVICQLGISRLKSDDVKGAIESFKNFNENFHSSELIDGVNYYLGYAYFKSGDYIGACQQLDNFLKAFPDSIYKDKAIYLLGFSFYNRKMFDEAIINFEKILQYFQHNKDLTQKAEYAIAYALYEQGKEAEAVKKIRQFINAHPDSYIAKYLTFWLGEYYYQNSLYELSRNSFQSLIANYPADKKLIDNAQYEIGLSYIAENKPQEALVILDKLSREANSQDIKIKSALAAADLLSQSNNTDEAVKAYESAIKMAATKAKNKTDIEIGSFLDYTDEETQLPKSAILDSTENQDNHSLIRLAYVRLGDLYKDAKDFNKAADSYRRAMKYVAAESNAYLQFKIGECLEEAGSLDIAIEEYLKVPYSKEGDKFWVVKGLLRSANIYEDKEDWQRAIAMYERVLNYEAPEADYAREKIDSIKNSIGRN